MILFFVSICSLLFSISQDNYNSVAGFLHNYTRPFTFLEISNDAQPYVYHLAHLFPRSVMVLIQTNKIKHHANVPHNVVVIQPKKMPLSALETLTRCEHFDVVFIHQPYDMIPGSHKSSLIDAYLKLGDYCFIEQATPDELLTNHAPLVIQKNLYLFNTPKKGLDIARWNLRNLPTKDPFRYQIESTFHEKFLIKRAMKTAWIPGINLLTFIMLDGSYPPCGLIVEELSRFKHLQHNDLVVGNFVVQGAHLKPIDFNDVARRVQSKKSIKAIIKLFKALPSAQCKATLLNDYQERIQKKAVKR